MVSRASLMSASCGLKRKRVKARLRIDTPERADAVEPRPTVERQVRPTLAVVVDAPHLCAGAQGKTQWQGERDVPTRTQRLRLRQCSDSA